MLIGTVFLLVCLAAMFRLHGTPLFWAAVGATAVNVVCLSVAILLRMAGGGSPPRTTTALQHLSAAFGGFLLLFSFIL